MTTPQYAMDVFFFVIFMVLIINKCVRIISNVPHYDVIYLCVRIFIFYIVLLFDFVNSLYESKS